MTNLSDQLKNLSPAKRALLEQKLAERNAASSAIPRRQAADPRVLSCAQHQMWFLDQLAPGMTAYNVPHFVRLRGMIDAASLKKALDLIVGRHEILRTMYLPYQGRVIPAVAKQWSVELLEIDVRGTSAADSSEEMDVLLREAGSRSFDLARDLKLRATLYRLADDRWIFFHLCHHIAWDLQSRIVFYRELEQLYAGLLEGKEEALPPLPIQYSDYALWQRRHLQGEVLDRLNSYWTRQLAGAPSVLEMPADFSRPLVQDTGGVRLPLKLSPEILDASRLLARENNVTLYMALLTVFYIFLHSYSRQEDISVGSPFDERRLKELEPIIGMFINTLVLRTSLNEKSTLAGLLPTVRQVVLGAISHQDLPFDKIVDAVQPVRDQGRMVLFQANFRLQGASTPHLQLAGAETELSRMVDNETSKFDLALELPSVPDGVGYLEYSVSLFKPETAQKMADDFQALIRELLDRPGTPLEQIEAFKAVRNRISTVRV